MVSGKCFLRILANFALSLSLAACGGGGSASTSELPAGNPVPTISSISPSSTTAGGAGFTLTVNGSNFVSGSVVQWNGGSRTTTFVSNTQLTTSIPSADIANAGTAQVTVFNPPPGGGTSSIAVFNINNPLPVITSLTPGSALAGDQGFTLTVDGSNFVSGSVVRWNGSDRTTTFVSSTQLTASIPPTDIASAGTADVTVFNPVPGGGTSNTATFTINNPVPAIIVLTPASATEGDSAFTMTVDGSNFVSASVVQWNGGSRTTTFVSTTQLTASIPSADIANAGTAQVTVFNPPPGGGTSNALTFNINASNAPRVIERVSVASDGTQGNFHSFQPSISAQGRFVAFTFRGSNLVAGDTNGSDDVLFRDTCIGAPASCTASTVQLSVASDGTQGNDASFGPALSTDGRFAAFNSLASNLVVGDTNGAQDGFVRDTCVETSGCISSTIRVSVASDGTQGGGFPYAISADGRFVTFSSLASNLVVGDTNGTLDNFVRDTCLGATGCMPSTIRVSVASDGTQGNGTSFEPAISADGRFVAFVSGASNLVAGDTNGATDIFVRDTCVGGPVGCTPSTVRVSVASDGTQGNNVTGSDSLNPSPSADGRFVAFSSTSDNLVPGDTNGFRDIFVHDRDSNGDGTFDELGAIATVRVSVASDGTQGNGGVSDSNDPPSISADGRFIAFASRATNLVAGDTNGAEDVFVRDTCVGASVGCVPSTVRVSVASDGTQSNSDSDSPSISTEGRFVAFTSFASNLVGSDTNTAFDVFLARTGFNRTSPVPALASLSPSSATAGGSDFTLTVTGSGFVPASMVRWNASDRVTIFLSSSKLLVRIPASDIATAGSVQVMVFNPAPGGGSSNALTFTIN